VAHGVDVGGEERVDVDLDVLGAVDVRLEGALKANDRSNYRLLD
jgi:hypothetical protein